MEICRACMTTSSNLMDIFSECPLPDYQCSLADMVNELVDFKVQQDDKLPQKMCVSCGLNVQIAFRFRQKFQETHKLLILKLMKSDPDDTVNLLETNAVIDLKHDEDKSDKDSNNKDRSKDVADMIDVSCTMLMKEEVEDSADTLDANWNEEQQQSYLSDAASTNDYESHSSKTKSHQTIRQSRRHKDYRECSKNPTKSNTKSRSISKKKTQCKKISSDTEQQADLYKCVHCEKTFNFRRNLYSHIRLHTKAQEFKCDQCPAAFYRIDHLTRHTRIHTGERPYKCSQCPMAFASGSTLKSHTYIHTGEKPFQCTHCSKAFRQISCLNQHLRTHTGERPYKCNHCPKDFANRSTLLSHIHGHANESGYKSHDNDDVTYTKKMSPAYAQE